MPQLDNVIVAMQSHIFFFFVVGYIFFLKYIMPYFIFFLKYENLILIDRIKKSIFIKKKKNTFFFFRNNYLLSLGNIFNILSILKYVQQ